MPAIIALTILLCIYAISELISQKTKAIFTSVLGIAALLLAGFWSGMLPATIVSDAAVDKIGALMAGLLITSLGTTIDFSEIKRQWKVVVTALACVIGAVSCIIFVGGIFVDRSIVIAGAPIFAGGSAATLIMTSALAEKGMQSATTFCVVLYVMQKFIGIPLSSILLQREAKEFIQDPNAVRLYTQSTDTISVNSPKRKILELPKSFDRPSVYLAKLAIIATIASLLSKSMDGIIHYYVMCLIMGTIFFALGFLDRNIMTKTQSGGLITFLVTIIIFSNLADATPAQVFESLIPLLISAICGVAGNVTVALICSKLLGIRARLAIALGLTCTYGFPTTMLMSKEIAEAVGQNDTEKAAIENYLLPKMLIAGFVTVTIVSVFIAGIVVNML